MRQYCRTTNILALALTIICEIGSRGSAELVYSTTFAAGAGPEWSSQNTEVTPLGARSFLGEFSGDDSVDLNLPQLSVHTSVTVSLQLFVLKTWDGSDTADGQGPDTWSLSVAGGPTLLYTTFNNNPVGQFTGVYGQAFPGNYTAGGSVYPPDTGAAERNTLGFTFRGSPDDAVYDLQFTFADSAPTLDLHFAGDLMQYGLADASDESWGITNVAVGVVPEPATLLLLGIGGVVMLLYATKTHGGKWISSQK